MKIPARCPSMFMMQSGQEAHCVYEQHHSGLHAGGTTVWGTEEQTRTAELLCGASRKVPATPSASTIVRCTYPYSHAGPHQGYSQHYVHSWEENAYTQSEAREQCGVAHPRLAMTPCEQPEAHAGPHMHTSYPRERISWWDRPDGDCESTYTTSNGTYTCLLRREHLGHSHGSIEGVTWMPEQEDKRTQTVCGLEQRISSRVRGERITVSCRHSLGHSGPHGAIHGAHVYEWNNSDVPVYFEKPVSLKQRTQLRQERIDALITELQALREDLGY